MRGGFVYGPRRLGRCDTILQIYRSVATQIGENVYSASTMPQPIPEQPTARLTIDVAQDTHRKLKILAINSGRTMRDIVVEWIEAGLAGVEQPGEPSPKKRTGGK